MRERPFTWGDVARQAALLSAAEEAALETIGQLPLVPTRDLARVCGASSVATLYRHVAGLTRRGLVAAVSGPASGCGPRQQLLLLDNLGLGVLSAGRGVDPRVVARRWRLHKAGLAAVVRNLPAVLAGYELLGLLAAALGCSARVQLWSSPWRLAAPPDARAPRPAVSLPARAVLEWRTTSQQRIQGAYLLLADTGGLSPAMMRPRLARLIQVLSNSGQDGPVLVVATTSRRRVDAWSAVLEDLGSRRPGARLDIRVATWQAWRSSGVRPPAAGRISPMPQLASSSACLRLDEHRAWVHAPRPIDADRLRASVADLDLSPGNQAVLDLVGRHPFVPTRTVADVLGKPISWARERRRELVGRGLLGVVHGHELTPDGSTDIELLEATQRGLAVLSGWLGMSLSAAVRHHGLAGGGRETPIGARGALARRMAHTLGTDGVFSAIARAARQQGGALVEWRNAACCAHGRVRPDGYGLLRLGNCDFGFFVEFDRGTIRPRALRAKFSAYHRYAGSHRSTVDYDGFPTVLVVTSGPGAEERLAEASWHSQVGRSAVLPVLLTTSGYMDSDPRGPLGSVWRTATDRRRRAWSLQTFFTQPGATGGR